MVLNWPYERLQICTQSSSFYVHREEGEKKTIRGDPRFIWYFTTRRKKAAGGTQSAANSCIFFLLLRASIGIQILLMTADVTWTIK